MHPGFQKGSKPLLPLDNPFPTKLPDDLFGERWAFVQLPYSGIESSVAFMSFVSQFHDMVFHVYKSLLTNSSYSSAIAQLNSNKPFIDLSMIHNLVQNLVKIVVIVAL